MRETTDRFEPNKLTSYCEEDVLQEIRRVVGTFQGEIPNSTQFKEISRVSLSQIRRLFGTYSAALQKAGLPRPTRRFSVSRRKYTSEVVFQNLMEVLDRAGGYEFSLQFYRENGGLFTARDSVKKVIGLSWNDMLTKIGAQKKPNLVHISAHSQRLRFLADISREDLLRELDSVWTILGKCPTRSEFNQVSKVHTWSIYCTRFKSWGRAIEALCEAKGVPMPSLPGTQIHKSPISVRPNDRKPLVNDDLLEALRMVKDKTEDQRLTYRRYKESGGQIHISTFSSHFGSWTNAVQLAGGKPGGRGGKARTDEEMFDELQRVWERLGHQPTFEEMKTHGSVNPHTYHKRFGTWMKAIHIFCEDRENRIDEVEEDDSHSTAQDSQVVEVDTPQVFYSDPKPSEVYVVRSTGRTVSKRLRFGVLVRDDFSCRTCGRCPKEHGVALEIDHIVPYSRGGETRLENLQTLCEDCNRGKGNNWSL